jgi:hypothetical protein
MTKETYLGDGVCAQFDGTHIVLTDVKEPIQVVILSLNTIARLSTYLNSFPHSPVQRAVYQPLTAARSTKKEKHKNKNHESSIR